MVRIRPSTRSFLWSAGAVLLVIPIALLRTMHWMRKGGAVGADLTGFWVEMVIGVLITFLGILIAWLRLLQDRKERARRPKPLDFD